VTPRLTITSAGTPGGAARAGHLGLQCSAGALLRGSLAVIKIRNQTAQASPRTFQKQVARGAPGLPLTSKHQPCRSSLSYPISKQVFLIQ
jgi:hypothetical protein